MRALPVVAMLACAVLAGCTAQISGERVVDIESWLIESDGSSLIVSGVGTQSLAFTFPVSVSIEITLPDGTAVVRDVELDRGTDGEFTVTAACPTSGVASAKAVGIVFVSAGDRDASDATVILGSGATTGSSQEVACGEIPPSPTNCELGEAGCEISSCAPSGGCLMTDPESLAISQPFRVLYDGTCTEAVWTINIFAYLEPGVRSDRATRTIEGKGEPIDQGTVLHRRGTYAIDLNYECNGTPGAVSLDIDVRRVDCRYTDCDPAPEPEKPRNPNQPRDNCPVAFPFPDDDASNDSLPPSAGGTGNPITIQLGQTVSGCVSAQSPVVADDLPGNSANEDPDCFGFVVPAGSTFTVSATAIDAGLDVTIQAYTTAGASLGIANINGAGGDETLAALGPPPSTSLHYACIGPVTAVSISGGYDLTVTTP